MLHAHSQQADVPRPLPHIEQLVPYVPGDSADAIRRAFDVADIVKLASNENPFGCSPWALAAAHRALERVQLDWNVAGERSRRLARLVKCNQRSSRWRCAHGMASRTGLRTGFA